MDYLTDRSGRVLRGTVNRLWYGHREVRFQDCLKDVQRENMARPPPQPLHSDTGQKKTLEKKDGRRMSFQKPKGTMEYTVESRDSLNSIALKFDTTPNELVQLNKLFSRAVVAGQLLYVADPDYISSVESSPSLSPISPLSPTSSEAEFEKSTDTERMPHKESTSSPAYSTIRPSRVVSSTSEEEEAFTEKFLKINCKYITDGKGTVSGVLLVTPNNIMFDPHKNDLLVQENGCEEYGIMCPMEEVTSAAMYKEIVNSKLKDSVPVDVDQMSYMREFCHFKNISPGNLHDIDSKMWDAGNDSASTAPRSTEESLSEDVFTESELSPIREEHLSSDELRQDKSSGASSESVQTINQNIMECSVNISDCADASDDVKGSLEPSGNDSGFVSSITDLERSELSINRGDDLDKDIAESSIVLTDANEGSKNNSNDGILADNQTGDQKHSSEAAVVGNHRHEAIQEEAVKQSFGDSETEVEELRKFWKDLTMQQAKQQREDMQHITQKEIKGKIAETQIEGVCSSVAKEKRRHRSHRYLCLRVGKPMRKTFVSQASASMQQYAQRDKLEYWFAVPHERSDHLYSFFIQWSPNLYAEEVGESAREPGFVVVKKNEEAESSDCSTNDSAARLWEVVSVAEYHRRIDALNTEELRTLCRRLKIFGALASEPFKVSDCFYGTGETFLFTFCPDYEVFKWTGDNMFFIRGDIDSLAFGGGGGEFALWLDGDLYHGRSHTCKTFGNSMLSKKEDFIVQDIEIWAFE
ncbi:hypothetical protein XELAEV_18033940mg [Xenopus laevis]|uniref:Oxidation resistance protein 1 n=1 Tax=Xenopus laevis TaxID=8355 RepID=A0A974CLB4_XENLA|nr:hypothetical protein XELAEV_18033940mg [Xenopus laevis]